jgi:hypothetical protein
MLNNDRYRLEMVICKAMEKSFPKQGGNARTERHARSAASVMTAETRES